MLLVSCLIFLTANPLQSDSLRDVVDVAKIAWEVQEDFKQISKNDLMVKTGNTIAKLSKMLQRIDSAEKELIEILKSWSEDEKLTLQEENFFHIKMFIDALYTEVDDGIKNNCSKCVKNLAKKIIDSGLRGVNTIISNAYSYLVLQPSENVVKLLVMNLKKPKTARVLCSLPLFPQQILVSFYRSAMVAEIKSYFLLSFAYSLKKMSSKGNYETKIRETEQNYLKRTKSLTDFFRAESEDLSRILWKCDPPQHILGQTYDKFTKLLEGYILNQLNLDKDGNCFSKCGSFKFLTKAKCRGQTWCEEQPTCEKIVDCESTDKKLKVFYEAEQSRGRRYEFVQLLEKRKYFGHPNYVNDNLHSKRLDAHRQFLFWSCDYCFCKCDQKGKFSDRFINLRASLADFDKNRVVTGLRFIKHNRIIHLQVQEGELLPYGNIENKTVRWVPVNNYKITDRYSYDRQDYHVFSFEEKALDLDDVLADNGHVITGVRLKLVKSHVRLEILQAPFDFNTGKLESKRNKFKDYSGARKMMRLDKAKVLGGAYWLSDPQSRSGDYVEFTHSSIEDDAAQNTVPFFDVQPVTSLQPLPLSGVGLFLKGQKGYGGFVTPRIFAYDMSKYMYLFQ